MQIQLSMPEIGSDKLNPLPHQCPIILRRGGIRQQRTRFLTQYLARIRTSRCLPALHRPARVHPADIIPAFIILQRRRRRQEIAAWPDFGDLVQRSLGVIQLETFSYTQCLVDDLVHVHDGGWTCLPPIPTG